MRVLVTGATGLLGRAVLRAAQNAGHDVTGVGYTRAGAHVVQADLTDAVALRALLSEADPDVVIHTAAERRPDVVEEKAEEVHTLNVDVPRWLADACAARTKPTYFLHLSTDYVFDGLHPPYDVDDPPHPLNAYGQSKWDAELAVKDAGKQGAYTTVRVPVLYGETEYDTESSVNGLLPLLSSTKQTRVDAHAVRYPTNVADVAQFLVSLAALASTRAMPPILHFSADEAMSKYDQCLVIARAWNRVRGVTVVSTDHLVPEYEAASPSVTKRPGHCKLDIRASQALGARISCVRFEAWWEEYLARRGPLPSEAAVAPKAEESQERESVPTEGDQEPATVPMDESVGSEAAPTDVADPPAFPTDKPVPAIPSSPATPSDEARYGARSPGVETPLATPPPSFAVRVCDPQRVSERLSSHVVYTVRVTTDAPFFEQHTFSALRRYSDFRWLHAALVQNHPGVIVPSIPEKVKLNNMAPALVEFRRRALELALTKVLQHPHLQKDADLLLFLQSKNLASDIKARDRVKGAVVTPEQKSYLGWSQSLHASRYHEKDEWFTQQHTYLAQLEARLHAVVQAVHTLAQRRQDLAQSQNQLHRHLVALSGSTLSRSVSTCFGALADVKKRAAEASAALAQHESQVLGLVFYEYERLMGNVHKAFATRIDVWQAWQRAEEELAKLRAHPQNTGHQDTPLATLTQAELGSASLRTRFEDVSLLCKEEMQRFEKEKVVDVRAALAEYLHTFQHVQQEIMDELAHCQDIVQRHVASRDGAVAAAPKEDAPPAKSSDDAAAAQPPDDLPSDAPRSTDPPKATS